MVGMVGTRTESAEVAAPPSVGRAALGGPIDRLRGRPPWFVITGVFIGLGWLRTVAEKAISTDWWTGTTLTDFVVEHQAATLPWARPFVELAVASTPIVVIGMIVAQFFVAISLMTHRHLTTGLTIGMAMNVCFLVVGAVNPSVFYLLAQGSMLLWLAGRQRRRPATATTLRLATAGAVALAVISIPFIQTLHPARVVDDPAVVMIMLGSLTALGCDLTHRRLFGSGLP